MTDQPDGSPGAPFELRVGTAKTYSIAWRDWLADGETVQSATWPETGGLTIANQQVNNADVTIDGETHPAATVTSARFSGAIASRLYEAVCQVVTTDGETERRSLWLLGVNEYSRR